MKMCNKCQIFKNESEFFKSKSSKTGFRSSCKLCNKEYTKNLQTKFEEQRKELNIQEKTCSRCKLTLPINNFVVRNLSKDGYNPACTNCIKIYKSSEKGQSSIARSRLKKQIDKPWKAYYEKNKNNPEYIARIKKNQQKFWNKESSKEYKRNYLKSPKYKAWRSKYCKLRRQTDFAFKLNDNMRKGIGKSLKHATVKKARRHWENLVGFDSYKLKAHLESMFKPGMTWENYGKWHVDHIRPVKSFNITGTDCEDFKKCWSIENLQPLWAHENFKKNSKWEPSTSTNTTA